MLQFKDFFPEKKITKKVFGTKFECAPLQEALSEANDWIALHDVEIINVETIVLPEMYDHEGSESSFVRTSGDAANDWFQFIRVWYK